MGALPRLMGAKARWRDFGGHVCSDQAVAGSGSFWLAAPEFAAGRNPMPGGHPWATYSGTWALEWNGIPRFG